jgi:CRISPR/Cas system-associated protein Cas10 (large subunit of type III CRISPR-Cas system)
MAHISLFEHLKTTGGFAVCLHDYLKDKQGKEEVEFNYQMLINEQPFLLTCWDVSGIQKIHLRNCQPESRSQFERTVILPPFTRRKP